METVAYKEEVSPERAARERVKQQIREARELDVLVGDLEGVWNKDEVLKHL